MLDQFTRPTGVGRYRLALPRFLRPKNGLIENLLKQQTYEREHLNGLPSNHLLVRIIHGSPLPWNKEDREFVRAARDRMYEVAGIYKCTSSVSEGDLHHPGVFYGEGVKECVLLHDTAFDTTEDWKTLKPIRVLSHPVTSLNLQPLTGEEREAMGYAVVSVNYVMLMWMYRQWVKDTAYSQIDEYQLSAGHFLRMFVLPSALESHLDLTIFNRAYNDLFTLADSGYDEKPSFYLVDYQKEVDETLEQWLRLIDRKPLTVEEVLRAFPMVVGETLYDWVELPEILVLKQTRWAIWLSWIKVIKFLVALDYLTNNRKNRTFRNDLLRLIQRTERSRWVPSHLEEIQMELESDFDLIKGMMA